MAGECQFDVYSDGKFEDLNPTSVTAVAGAVVGTIDEYFRDNLKTEDISLKRPHRGLKQWKASPFYSSY